MSNFTNVTALNYCVQHVLPLVYDDSLSYMELLNKVVFKLNELISNNQKIPDYISELIKNYITSGEIEKILSDILANYMLNVKFPPEGLKPAIGNGTDDDTEAIQGCIDYAFNNNGMAVYFPSGNYLVSSLTLKNKSTLFGQDRYTTKLTLKGGTTTPLFSGNVDDLTISGISFDGNMDVQVNNVNLIELNINSALISNVILTDGYELLNLTVNNNLQINNVIFLHAVKNSFVINGAGYVQGDNLIFESLSSLLGENFLVINANKCILEKIRFKGTAPNCLLLTGNNNLVSMWNETGVVPYTDNGSNNSVTVYTNSEKTNLSGDKIINADNFTVNINNKNLTVKNNYNKEITGNETVLIEGDKEETVNNTYVIAANELFLNPSEPLKYGMPLSASPLPYNRLPLMNENGDIYNVMIENPESENIQTETAGIYNNKKIVIYGDSSGTYQNNFVQKLIDSGLNIVNRCIGGTTFTRLEPETYPEFANNSGFQLIQNANDLNGFDYLFIIYTINDWQTGRKLKSREANDEFCYSYCIEYIAKFLSTKYPNLKPIFIFPWYCNRMFQGNKIANDRACSIDAYIDTAINILQKYSIDYINLFNISGVNESNYQLMLENNDNIFVHSLEPLSEKISSLIINGIINNGFCYNGTWSENVITNQCFIGLLPTPSQYPDIEGVQKFPCGYPTDSISLIKTGVHGKEDIIIEISGYIAQDQNNQTLGIIVVNDSKGQGTNSVLSDSYFCFRVKCSNNDFGIKFVSSTNKPLYIEGLSLKILNPDTTPYGVIYDLQTPNNYIALGNETFVQMINGYIWFNITQFTVNTEIPKSTAFIQSPIETKGFVNAQMLVVPNNEQPAFFTTAQLSDNLIINGLDVIPAGSTCRLTIPPIPYQATSKS